MNAQYAGREVFGNSQKKGGVISRKKIRKGSSARNGNGGVVFWGHDGVFSPKEKGMRTHFCACVNGKYDCDLTEEAI